MINSMYTRSLKRNRQNRTNYRKRAALLISRRAFITIRISNQNLLAQVLTAELNGDLVVASAHSRELTSHGWKGSLNSIPTCYLTGLLLGKKSLVAGIKDAILYTGKTRFTSRVAACLKGILDSGVDIPVSQEVLPSESRIKGEHISKYAQSMKEDKEKYDSRFSLVLKRGLQPEDYPSHFEELKRILSGMSHRPDNESQEMSLTKKNGEKRSSRRKTENAPTTNENKTKGLDVTGRGTK
jgi:large subunit ribosomal protein L18